MVRARLVSCESRTRHNPFYRHLLPKGPWPHRTAYGVESTRWRPDAVRRSLAGHNWALVTDERLEAGIS